MKLTDEATAYIRKEGENAYFRSSVPYDDRETEAKISSLIDTERLKSVDHPLITVDGPCASGKSTLAGKMAVLLGASVIHTDDFVIPHAQKTPERLSVPGGNCDVDRLVREVVEPWKRGMPVLYRRYDCRSDCLLETERLPDCDVLILEGSYCNLPAIRRYADIRIFLNTPWEIREKRLAERESEESLRRFYDRWIPLENAYFDAYGLPDDSCIIF